MRDLGELNINEGGYPVDRVAPSYGALSKFEQALSVDLPADYKALLRFSNGGHPQLDSFDTEDGQWSINRFYHLTSDVEDVGGLWWAATHRDHHRFSDGDRDPHSPVKWGLLHAQVGWLYDHNGDTDYARVKDLAKYPELVVLNKLWLLPPTIMGVLCYIFLGLDGLLVGFMLSTAVLWHCTFTINSLAHVWGSRRYETEDDSRNNLWLALLTMGEGWHNNHHHFMGSTRQGFYWWEIDMSYYVIKAMSWVGLVWDVKEPPARVYEPSDRALPPDDSEPREAA